MIKKKKDAVAYGAIGRDAQLSAAPSARLLWDGGLLLLLFLAMLQLCAVVFWAMGTRVGLLTGILAFGLSAQTYAWWRKDRPVREKILVICGALAVIALATLISMLVYDKSYDGNSYHKLAVGYMTEGWNPLYESSEVFNERLSIIFDSRKSIWIDHYAKASWTYGAVFYDLTGSIEAGKGYTLVAMAATFGIAYGYLRRRFLNAWQSAASAGLLVLNPVALGQMMTYYIDGFLGVLIYALLIMLVSLTDKEDKAFRPEAWTGLALAVVVLANIKITGLAFSAIFCLVFYVFWGIRAKSARAWRSMTLYFTAVVVVAVGIIGAPTYMTNLIQHQNPLYPLFGPDKVDIITNNQPASFEGASGLEKLFYATFSRVDNLKKGSTEEAPSLKLPFTFSRAELARLGSGDLRQSGFGAFFSGIFVLSLIGVALGLAALYRKNRDVFALAALSVGACVLLTLVWSESWWARYAPQLYVLPVLALILGFGLSKGRAARLVPVAFGLLIALNASFFGLGRISDLRSSQAVRAQFRALENAGPVDVYLTVGNKQGLVFNVRDVRPDVILLNQADDENAPADATGYTSIYYNQIIYRAAGGEGGAE